MKKLLIIISCLAFSILVNAQITISKANGGSVMLKKGIYNVNSGSTLKREWIVLNNENCPVQLGENVGINTKLDGSSYRFQTNGSIKASNSIVAVEINYVLYDIFGRHIKTLRDLYVTDFIGTLTINKKQIWHASYSEIVEYLSWVSYVTAVRTKTGEIWKYEPEEIIQELQKIQISYEEGYNPKKNEE